MPRKRASDPPAATAPTGWAKRLPTPVEMVAGKRKKVLRTLSDVRGFMQHDLPPEVAGSKDWQSVAGALIEAAKPEGRTSNAEIALRLARLRTRSKP
jgi:hypothetical protein